MGETKIIAHTDLGRLNYLRGLLWQKCMVDEFVSGAGKGIPLPEAVSRKKVKEYDESHTN